MVIRVEPQGSGKTILIGAFHLSRTAEFLSDCISLASPGFCPDKSKLVELESRLGALTLVQPIQ